MNKKALIPLGISILLGVIAVYLVNHYIKAKENKMYAGMEMTTVIAATKEIPAGTSINPDMFSSRNVPQKYVHGNTITPNDFKMVVGEILKFPLKRGDTLLWSDLGKKVEKRWGELSSRLSKGERAISLQLDNIGGVSGFLRPNDRIDILGTFRNKESGEEATITILQNMTILATGSAMSGGAHPGKYGDVTLLVTLEEAELLVFAQRQGTLVAALRNPEDLETFEDIPRVNFSNIMKSDFRKKIQKKRNDILGQKKRDDIEVIKKGKILERIQR